MTQGSDDTETKRQVDSASAATTGGEVPDITKGGGNQLTTSRAVPLTVGACFFMEGLDSTIIATSLPQIADALAATANEIGVSMTAYLISVSMWMAASGWLADRFEARRVFLAAIVVFVLGSIVCGMSQTLTQLVVGRFFQGMGGALMTPVGRLILARGFPRDELVKAMSYMVIPGLVGPMLGPVIGGWITTYTDWRWIFFINVPLGIIGIVLALTYLRRIESVAAPRFDVVGFVLVAVTLVALQTSLEIVAMEMTLGSRSLAALGIGLLGMALYARHSRRADPILDLRLFRYRTFAVAVLGGSFSRIVLGATLFLFPLYFQLGLGVSAVSTGYLMAAFAFGQIALRVGLDPLLKRLGIKKLLVASSAVLGIMLVILPTFGSTASLWTLAAFMFVFGLINSIQLSTLGALSFSGLPEDALARATSVSAVMQRLTTAFGISLTAILLGIASGGAEFPVHGDFLLPTLVLAGTMVLSVASFMTLRQRDGEDLMKKA